MKVDRKSLLGLLILVALFSCVRTPQHPDVKDPFMSTVGLDAENINNAIELHRLSTIPQRLGTIYFGVSEALNTEEVRASVVQVVDAERSSNIVSSGFFVAPDKIATNIHVCADANPTSVYIKGEDASWEIRGVVAYDVKNDLVILEIAGEGVPLSIGDSDAVKNGEPVFSVGYPYERYNVAKNTISPTRCNNTWFRMTPDVLPGSSGGPVLNAKCEVIGVNVIGTGSYACAIASNTLKVLLTDLKPPESLVEWQEKNPIRAYAYLAQASRKIYTDDYACVIDVLDRAIKLNPTYAGIYMIYGNRGYAKNLLAHAESNKEFTRKAQQYYRAAIKDYDEALRFDPVYDIAYSGRALSHVALGQHEFKDGPIENAYKHYYRAIKDFDEVISLNSENAYAYSDRGYARICLGNLESYIRNTEEARNMYKAAIIDSGMAIQRDPENPYFYHTRGVARAMLNDYNQAIADFDKTISLKPDFTKAYYNRAFAKEVIGQMEAAKTDYKKAKELNSDSDSRN